MRAARFHVAALAIAGTLAAAAPAVAVPPGRASVAKTPTAQPAKVEHDLAILITKRTLVPKIQRTVRFTGYATYTFSAPPSRRIVSASAQIVGAQAHAVRISRRTVAHDGKRYTVNLVFPGEQGNPGKLVVRLGTVAT